MFETFQIDRDFRRSRDSRPHPFFSQRLIDPIFDAAGPAGGSQVWKLLDHNVGRPGVVDRRVLSGAGHREGSAGFLQLHIFFSARAHSFFCMCTFLASGWCIFSFLHVHIFFSACADLGVCAFYGVKVHIPKTARADSWPISRSFPEKLQVQIFVSAGAHFWFCECTFLFLQVHIFFCAAAVFFWGCGVGVQVKCRWRVGMVGGEAF